MSFHPLTIILDMDGILNKIHKIWLELYNQEWEDNLTLDQITQWDMRLFVKPKCGRKIFDYLNRQGFFRGIEPMDGAIEGVRSLMGDGHDVYIASACHATNPFVYQEKKEWIQEFLPEMFKYPNRFIAAHQKHLIAGDILFDDAPSNLINWTHGPRVVGRPKVAVAMDYPFNRELGEDGRKIPRVPDWEGFLGFIRKFSELSFLEMTIPNTFMNL